MSGVWHWECEEVFYDGLPVRSFYLRAWHDEFPNKPIGTHFGMGSKGHGLEGAVAHLLHGTDKILELWRKQAA